MRLYSGFFFISLSLTLFSLSGCDMFSKGDDRESQMDTKTIICRLIRPVTDSP